MDFKQLELFVLLAEELHFARTARRCFMTASALTRSIQRLEEELDVELFIRDNRKVELTQAGKHFLEFAKESLQKYVLMKQMLLQQSKAVTGQLKVYGSTTASYGVLSKLLSEFRLVHPQVELQLHTGDQADAIALVMNGKEDIAIAAMPDELPAGVLFKTLLFSPLRFIQPTETGLMTQKIEQAKDARGLIDIEQLPLIVSERGLARKRLEQWMHKHNVNPNIYAQVSGHESIVTLVALGFGVGIVPELVVEHSPFRDKIKLIENAPELQAFQIGLCAMSNKINQPVIRAFWESADPVLFKDGVSNG